MMFFEVLFSALLDFFTNFFTEIMLVELMFCTVYPHRKYWYVSVVLWLATNIGMICVPDLYSLQGALTFGGWLNLSFMLAFLLSTVFFFATVKISVRDAVFYSSSAYALQNFVHNLSFFVNDLFSIAFRTRLWQGISFVILLISLVLFYIIFVGRIKRGEDTAIKNKILIITSLLTVAITYFLSLYLLPSNTENNAARIYAAICCLFLLFMQFSIFDKTVMQRENETLAYLWQAEQKQYELWKVNVDVINTKCHDLKHQINIVRNLKDDLGREESFKEIENAILIYDNIPKTGNETLDIILTEKCLYCEKKHIKFTYIVDGKKLSLLKDGDICSLFGNAIDNAIEGVENLSDPERRMISLNVYKKDRFLHIHIDNYHDKKVKIVNGLPVTTKGDATSHGFGVKSISMVTKKYGGELLISADDEIFNLDILFPL